MRQALLGVLAAVLMLSAVGYASAQTLRDRALQIRAAMDDRDFDRAEQFVRNLRSAEPDAFKLNNYDYLLARLDEQRGELTEAAALYLELLKRNSILSSYALRHLASVARASGDLLLERQYLSRLMATAPSSTAARDARERLIDNYLESADYRAAIPLLHGIATDRGPGRGAMAKLGDAYLKAGDKEAARRVFLSLEEGSRDDNALQAALGLDELDAADGAKLDQFESLHRARIYLQNRHWAEARKHLMDILGRFPDSPNRGEALYQTGFTYYREDKFDEAVKWFDRVHQELPQQKEGEQGFYWVATSLQKAARYGEAARRYSDFLNAYPDSEYTGRAYLNIVDCHRYAGEDGEAIQFAEQIERQFAGKPLSAVGLFDQARVQLSDGNYGRALDLLAKLEAHPVSPKQMGAPIPGEVEFLRAVTIEQMGRLGEAANLYLVIPDVRDNYFGHQATLRLQAMAATEKGRKVIGPLQIQYHAQARRALASGQYVEAKDAANRALRLSLDKAESQDLLDMLKACYSHLSQYSSVFQYRLAPAGRAVLEAGGTGEKSPTHEALASELIFLGLYDEGARELRQAGSIGGLAREAQPGERWHRKAAVKSEGGGEPAYSMAVYSNRGDQAHYAVAFGEPLFKSMPADYNLALLPRDLVELVYPAPYRAPLTRAARALGVDPRLILSLARQESRFDPEAKSPASARGLLQFIPETALKLAREEGLSKFQLDDVYDPKVALALTARYLSDLSKLFPDNPYAMAASYDAGEDSVQRWISRSRSTDVDRFVAEIAIPETADYVAKVMSNYRAYLELYTIDLKPKN